MKRTISFNALLCSSFILIGAASAQDVGKQPTQSSVVKTAADAAEHAAKLREILSYSDEKLHELARERAFKALAALGPGQKLARWSAREQNTQNSRLQCLEKVQKAESEREELRKELEAEMEQIRRQFAGDDAECQRQLLIVIDAYKPRLKELKTEADRWTAKMNGTDEQLAEIRRNVVGLERDVRLAERGIPFRSRTSPEAADNDTSVAQVLKDIGVDFDSDQLNKSLSNVLEEKVSADVSAEKGTSAPETRDVQKALAELEDLFD